MKLSRLAVAIAAATMSLAAATVSANQSLVSPGYSATIGGVTNRSTIHSSTFNPASNNLLIEPGEKYRFGYFSNIGGYIELGDVDDLDVKVDNLVDDLDAADNLSDPFLGAQSLARLAARYPAVNQNLTGGAREAAYFEAIAAEANTNLLRSLEEGGQLRLGGQLQVPLTPFLFNSTKANGTFGLNASVSMQTKGAFLGGPFGVRTTVKSGSSNLGSLDVDLSKAAKAYTDVQNIVGDGKNVTQADIIAVQNVLQNSGLLTPQNAATIQAAVDQGAGATFDTESTLTTNSGLEVKAARIAHLSLDYGTSLTDMLDLNNKYGQLETGIRLNLYQVEAARNFISLQAESNLPSGNDASDGLTDDVLENTETSSAVGLDIGFLWHADNYQAGLTFYNLNEPTIDFPNPNQQVMTNDNVGTYRADRLAAFNGLAAAGKLDAAASVKLTSPKVPLFQDCELVITKT